MKARTSSPGFVSVNVWEKEPPWGEALRKTNTMKLSVATMSAEWQSNEQGK
jgi:hypothetical protein